MIDSHCHVQVTEKFGDAKGCAQYCISAVTEQDNEELLKFRNDPKVLSLGFGLHPHHADEFSDRLLAEVTQYLKSVPRSFVGEIGLELRPQYCEKILLAQQLVVF